MSGIVWLASYPKSGNTWFRAFLTNYLRDANQPASINDLDGEPIASARPPLDDALGYECSNLSHDEVEMLRPEYYLDLARQARQPLYCKIHDAYHLLPDGRPLLPPQATRAALYFVRNPLDVCVSLSHHYGHENHRETAGRMARDDYYLCGATDKQALQVRQRLSSWGSHASSWLDAKGIPIHVLRYEDMQITPEATFGAAVRFLQLDFTPGRLHKALEFSRFAELQRQEQASGFQEMSSRAAAFFRKGQVGSWREALPDDLACKLIDDHGAVMYRLGYLDARRAPVF